ncbi:MAG: tRNA (adenosine(37)-N6)-threonylcarbamoyltransferase complex ATPase subunit type 1 TsaE [Pseudomonadota bacterium]
MSAALTGLTLFLADEEDSHRFGMDLALSLRAGDAILLSGDLGSGKTTIARALIRTHLADDEAEVPSPTFTLVNAFEAGRIPLYHYDFYRITEAEEIEEIGFSDHLEGSITLVEWPENAEALLPQMAMTIRIEIEGTGRRVTLGGDTRIVDRVNRSLRIRDFLEESGFSSPERRFLQGDASSRAYEIIKDPARGKAILMNWPAQTEQPVLQNGKTYSEAAHLATDVGPFVAIGEALRGRGFPAPELYGIDLDRGFLIMEDFGSATVAENSEPVISRYEVAVDLLARLHSFDWPDSAPVNEDRTHYLSTFDRSIFDIEIGLLIDWYVPHVAEKTLSERAKQDYNEIWSALFQHLEQAEKSWLLRDFHSPNLMWRENKTGEARIGLIDYQDALIGPSAYDVASLCQDARVTVTAENEKALVNRYVAARIAVSQDFDTVDFARDYAIIAAQRGTRLLGLWPRLKVRDAKPHYMKHMPRTIDYLDRALCHPALSDLAGWYRNNLGLFVR